MRFLLNKSILSGAFLIIGTSVGAGMFALPIYASYLWFFPTISLLLWLAYASYTSGLYLIEGSMIYNDKVNYATISERILGKYGYISCLVSVCFVNYILLYAYNSGGGSILQQILSHYDIQLSLSKSIMIFGFIFIIITTFGIQVVNKMTYILLISMFIAFCFALLFMMTDIRPMQLTYSSIEIKIDYAFSAIPIILTSFGFHGIVIPLAYFYHRDNKKIKTSISLGVFLIFVIYFLWISVVMGLIPQPQLSMLLNNNSNISDLIQLANNYSTQNLDYVEMSLIFFGNMALISSYIGVALGAIEFVRDALHLSDSIKDTLLTSFCALFPQYLLAIIFPNGFLHAIGYAGIFASIYVLILPSLLAFKINNKQLKSSFQISHQRWRIYFTLISGIVVLFSVISIFLLH